MAIEAGFLDQLRLLAATHEERLILGLMGLTIFLVVYGADNLVQNVRRDIATMDTMASIAFEIIAVIALAYSVSRLIAL